ncbi:restriction endonuclease subunit S [Streptococcus suis]|nr:restriction endonuclease subunit S [Streptococcus suis]
MPNKERNIPKRRFKEFENADAWELRKLGEVAPLRGGFAFKSSDFVKEGIPIVRISNILSNGRVGAEFVHYKELEQDERFTLHDGAAVLAMSGATTGKVSVLHVDEGEKYYQNQRVGYFTPTPEYNYDFIKVIVNSTFFTTQLSSVLVAGAQPNISSKEVDDFCFAFPKSLPEQEAIGTFFSTLDRHITLHQRKLDKLKSVKQAYLSEMFPAEGERVPKRRFPGFTDDWELRKLGEVAEINPKSQIPEKFEYVDLESVVGTSLISHRTVRAESAPSRAQRLALPGDIFYQTVRPYQKNNYLFDLSDDNYVFSTGYAQLRPKIDDRYLMIKIQDDGFVKEVLDRCTGTSYPAINSKDLSQISIDVPTSLPEQEAIGTFFSTLDQQITLHQRKLEKLKNLKKALLNELFV